MEQGRGEVERRDPLTLDQLERLLRIPPRLGDVTAADEVHREQGVDAHRVVERHHAEGAVAVAVAVLQRLAEPAGPVGRVGARDALRSPGRARGVEEERDLAVVAVERALVRGARRAAGRRRGSRAPPRHRRRSRRAPPRTAATRAARRPRPPTGTPSRGAPSRAGCRGRPRPDRPARRRARRRSARPAAAARRSGSRGTPRAPDGARRRRAATAPGSLAAPALREVSRASSIAATIGA